MQRIHHYSSRTAAVIAGSVLIALPAAAIDQDKVIEICLEWLENHKDEPEWYEACDHAVQQWMLQEPPELPAAQIPKLTPSGVFPIAQTAIVDGPHDGDRDSILGTLRAGQSAEILVEFEVSEIRDQIHTRALEQGIRFLDADQLAEKRAAYASIKQDGLTGIEGVTVLREYENLPTSFIRVSSEAALNSLIARSAVKAVYENGVSGPALAQSLPLIAQNVVETIGLGGAGTTIAVLDSGVDFTHAEFGSCTSPGIPAGCRIVNTFEAAPNDFVLDHSGHGTNVSAIAAATAGEADLVVADVFDGNGIFDADVEAAVDWAIAIQSTFNIVAMNLSIGRFFVRYTSPCTGDPFATPMAEALAAGIQPIASAMNHAFAAGFYEDGIAPPACVPAAVSVGAVYDANVGPRSWCANQSCTEICTDSTTTADKLVCFSQSAPILSLLAPGALITAGGFADQAGTSQAAPHVTGAWSIMRAVSDLSEATLLQTLQEIGEPVTDARPSPDRTTSRLDLLPEPAFLSQITIGAVTLGVLRLRRSRRCS